MLGFDSLVKADASLQTKHNHSAFFIFWNTTDNRGKRSGTRVRLTLVFQTKVKIDKIYSRSKYGVAADFQASVRWVCVLALWHSTYYRVVIQINAESTLHTRPGCEIRLQNYKVGRLGRKEGLSNQFSALYRS